MASEGEEAGTPPEASGHMRPFKTAFPQEFLAAYHPGTMNYTYRGVPCLKSPIELAL